MPTIGESIQVWVVPLVGQTAERWRLLLSPAEWAKAMRFRFAADQVRSAVTRGVLRTLLGRYLSVDPLALEFSENEFGKPAVPGIEFNASHSGDYALLAFSACARVGIDVEHRRGNRVVADLALRVLTPAEYQRFMALAEVDHERTFFDIWALKESVLKGIGSGLSVPPEDIEISFYPSSPRLLSADTPEVRDISDWTIQSLDIGDPAYAAALAVEHPAPHIELNHFE